MGKCFGFLKANNYKSDFNGVWNVHDGLRIMDGRQKLSVKTGRNQHCRKAIKKTVLKITAPEDPMRIP